MLLTDVYFFFSMLPLAILTTIAAFYWKQLWWIGMLSGGLWIILGLWALAGQYNPVITMQRELSIVFIIVGIGVFFLPFYLNRQQNKSMNETMDELDSFKSDMDEYQADLNKYRSLRRNRLSGK